MSNNKYISDFHYITQDVPGYSHSELAERACKGGADWAQLRVKGASYKIWKEIALQVKAVCQKYNATFIINDNVELAKEIEADGVHLGSNDMNPAEAREVLGINFIIGGTANTFDDIEHLLEQKVDYIGLGPFRFTATKKDLSPVLGLDGIKTILCLAAVRPAVPIIAIGGIKLNDIKELIEVGIHGVAVSSAINLTEDKLAMTEKFLEQLTIHPVISRLKSAAKFTPKGTPLGSFHKVNV
ncbi:thiamine phosphate synthase [bacterium AH-315-M05]|nr:thiamine phosphate synthase [bacterium AH-315-M05]